jgi:glutamate N-acetyltransferase/amino-acid N-acetyltransferase
MPVKLITPLSSSLLPVNGIELGSAEAGLRQLNRKDVLVIKLIKGTHVSAVFTQNRFCAAPVTLCKAHLSETNNIRALLVNTGSANALTGSKGLDHAKQCCEGLGQLLAINSNQVLPFSTGVILEPLPVDKLIASLPTAINHLSQADWLNAAETMMTTDIVPKGTSRQLVLGDQSITITGISKGSGMIHPNMATMLGYIATDVVVSKHALDAIINYAVNQSFNCITVDGDTSTNDSFIMMATNLAGNQEITEADNDFIALRDAMTDVAIELAQAIVRDGEGATKFMTIAVEGGRTKAECRKVADAIAHSPLVKTAFFASDPNLGRILAAIGYADVEDLDINALQLYLGEVLVAENGGVAATYKEALGTAIMQESDILVRVALNRGKESATIWTCDFSYDYVKINADYRS